MPRRRSRSTKARASAAAPSHRRRSREFRARRLQRPRLVGRRRSRPLGGLRGRALRGPLRRPAPRLLRLAGGDGDGKPHLVGAPVDKQRVVRQRGAVLARRAELRAPSHPNERLREVPMTSVRAVMGPPEQRCWVEREPGRPAPRVERRRRDHRRRPRRHPRPPGRQRHAAKTWRPSAAPSAAPRSAPTSVASATPHSASEVRRCENVTGRRLNTGT